MESLLDERDRSFLNEFSSGLVVEEDELAVTSALGLFSCFTTAQEGGGGAEVKDGGRERGGGGAAEEVGDVSTGSAGVFRPQVRMGGKEEGVPQPTPVEEGGGIKGVSPLVRGREPE